MEAGAKSESIKLISVQPENTFSEIFFLLIYYFGSLDSSLASTG